MPDLAAGHPLSNNPDSFKRTNLFRASLEGFAQQMRYFIPGKESVVAFVATSGTGAREAARQQRGVLTHPFFEVKLNSVQRNVEGYSPKRLARMGVAYRTQAKNRVEMLHMIPVLASLNVVFECKDVKDAFSFIEETNLAFIDNRFDFTIHLDKADTDTDEGIVIKCRLPEQISVPDAELEESDSTFKFESEYILETYIASLEVTSLHVKTIFRTFVIDLHGDSPITSEMNPDNPIVVEAAASDQVLS